MFALNEVLCPTQFYGLSSKLVPAVTVYNRANEYDWCGLVFEHLIYYLKRFQKNFQSNGFASGCAGCTIFLLIFYLDRLKRKHVAWGLRPRIKYWTLQRINKAKEEDKCDTGDFGKLGCIDIAYGEPHPQVAHDIIPSENEGPEIGGDDEDYMYAKKCRCMRKKKLNKLTRGNPNERREAKRRREETSRSRRSRSRKSRTTHTYPYILLFIV